MIPEIIPHRSWYFPRDMPTTSMLSNPDNSSLFLSAERISNYTVNFIPPRSGAEDACPKCITRKRGKVISIPSDKNCKIVSDPYPRYEGQDTGIYNIVKHLALAKFRKTQSTSLFAFRQSGNHVQTCCSDKRQSCPTRKEPFNHGTRPACVSIRV